MGWLFLTWVVVSVVGEWILLIWCGLQSADLFDFACLREFVCYYWYSSLCCLVLAICVLRGGLLSRCFGILFLGVYFAY